MSPRRAKVWPVKLSVKSDYAARAVLGLARQFPSGAAVRADDVAAEQGIPGNYLVQILIELKSAQIVRSVRGKEGGYLLARPPAEITLGQVVRAGPAGCSAGQRRAKGFASRVNRGRRRPGTGLLARYDLRLSGG